MQYRRVRVKGGTFFFTLVTYKRRKIFTSSEVISILRNSFKKVQQKQSFRIDGMVLLPDHLHCIWTLPEKDSDFSIRWRLIKSDFTRNYNLHYPENNQKVWQARFWEHMIRDEEDYKNHLDYIHYNPVKHGLVKAPRDWKYSSFKRSVKRGEYDNDWGELNPVNLDVSIGSE